MEKYKLTVIMSETFTTKVLSLYVSAAYSARAALIQCVRPLLSLVEKL